jgi:hypothetical protein
VNYAPPMWSKARGATMSDNDTCAAKFFRGWSEYIAAVVVAVCALISFPAEAKHATLKDQPDDQTQNPAAAKDEPQSGKSTVIKGEFVEVRDRLSPAAQSGIRRQHTFTVTMSNTHHVDEEWTDSDTRGRTFGRRHPKITRQDADSATIGDTSQHVVWHVLGPRKLQRIFAGQHYLMTIEIEVSESNACRLDVRYLKQVGFEAITLEQPNGTMAEFSLPQVENASCAIE